LRQPLTARYRERLAGVLSCYDRIIITGTLPGACYAKGMTGFLSARQIRIFDYPRFAEPLRDRVRERAAVLYILCRTDALFPPKIAPDVIKALTAAGVEARYFELDSDLGHSSSGPEHAKWSPVLREFLAPLVARLN
jgi:hypothetical protein